MSLLFPAFEDPAAGVVPAGAVELLVGPDAPRLQYRGPGDYLVDGTGGIATLQRHVEFGKYLAGGQPLFFGAGQHEHVRVVIRHRDESEHRAGARVQGHHRALPAYGLLEPLFRGGLGLGIYRQENVGARYPFAAFQHPVELAPGIDFQVDAAVLALQFLLVHLFQAGLAEPRVHGIILVPRAGGPFLRVHLADIAHQVAQVGAERIVAPGLHDDVHAGVDRFQLGKRQHDLGRQVLRQAHRLLPGGGLVDVLAQVLVVRAQRPGQGLGHAVYLRHGLRLAGEIDEAERGLAGDQGHLVGGEDAPARRGLGYDLGPVLFGYLAVMGAAEHLQVHQPQDEDQRGRIGQQPEEIEPFLRYLAVDHKIPVRRLSQ